MTQGVIQKTHWKAYKLLNRQGVSCHSLKISLQVDECEIPMEIDIGASMSIISEDTYRKI